MQPPQRSPFKGGAGQGVIQSQLLWAPASGASSNTLTLLPAGHAAGFYEISIVVIVRTTVSGTVSGTMTWTSPTYGAESTAVAFTGSNAVIGGTSFNTSGTTSQNSQSPRTIFSSGATAITFTFVMSGHAGAPVFDVYASARLVAA